MAKYTVIVPGYAEPTVVVVPEADRAEVNDLGNLIFVSGHRAVAVFRDWSFAQEATANA